MDLAIAVHEGKGTGEATAFVGDERRINPSDMVQTLVRPSFRPTTES
jgi:hypothetical protein